MDALEEDNKYENRLYYSISEVSHISKIEKHVIRYWEKEFKQLKLKKNKKGVRSFRKSDLEMVLLIKKLLYVDLYSIAGARKYLEKQKEQKGNFLVKLSRKKLKQELLKIKKYLEILREE